MTINGKDISEYGKVKQWTVEMGTRDMKNETEWNRGSPLPLFQTPTAQFKSLEITLMVYGESRAEIFNIMSDILADLNGITEIELDKIEHVFCGLLDKSNIKTVSDTSINRFQKLELDFDVYEHGYEDITEYTGTTTGGNATLEIEVNNPGNMPSPVKLEITPLIGQADIEISGICRDSETGADLPVTISNLTTGNVITLDGIEGLITENGELKAGDVDMWALPTVLPGKNIIAVDTQYIDMTITVLPIYM